MTAEQEEVATALEETKAALAECHSESEAYHLQLQLAQERYVGKRAAHHESLAYNARVRPARFEKLPMIQRVDEWMSGHTQTCEAAEYGDTLAAVSNLLYTFAETYTASLPAKEEVRQRPGALCVHGVHTALIVLANSVCRCSRRWRRTKTRSTRP